MAILYNKKKHEEIWSDTDIACVIEEAQWELNEFLCSRDLDGHMRDTQWYMAMWQKLDELIELMGKCPNDELDPDIVELM